MLLQHRGLGRGDFSRFIRQHSRQNPVDGDGRPRPILAPAPPQNRPPVDAEGVPDLMIREARRPEFVDQFGRLRFNGNFIRGFCLRCNQRR